MLLDLSDCDFWSVNFLVIAQLNSLLVTGKIRKLWCLPLPCHVIGTAQLQCNWYMLRCLKAWKEMYVQISNSWTIFPFSAPLVFPCQEHQVWFLNECSYWRNEVTASSDFREAPRRSRNGFELLADFSCAQEPLSRTHHHASDGNRLISFPQHLILHLAALSLLCKQHST